MVEYFGKHSCKLCIRNTPIYLGYNIWYQYIVPVYLIEFDPYQGKSDSRDEDLENKLGKGAVTILQLLNTYTDDKKSLPSYFFTDNLFTTTFSLQEVQKRGYEGTGAIISNRIDKKCPISSPKLCVNEERVYSECATRTTKYFKVKISGQKDSAIVIVASTTGNVKRWSKQQKKFIEIDVASGIKEYNMSMGGRDRMDQN
ncbi:piggyBac transposable element-derived protein 3-like [Lepeophtheirus salmonis]|uniref:piggyBac transposable element-derived protein 3-like n=1 Tax=Lepeophtheirus salmonis TaxID=72036 RepID=UPI003AF38A3D